MNIIKKILILPILFLFISAKSYGFYIGGSISINGLILKKDLYALDDFNLEMNEVETSINFLEASTPGQYAKVLSLSCAQDTPIEDLDILAIAKRCTNNGHIRIDEIFIEGDKGAKRFNKIALPFIFSKAISNVNNVRGDDTVIHDLKIDINKNNYSLEVVLQDKKIKVKGKIDVNKEKITIKVESAKYSIFNVKSKLLKEIKKLENGTTIILNDDVISIQIASPQEEE